MLVFYLFEQRFSDVVSLMTIEQCSGLKLRSVWQLLGYYSR
jgi:hypothetical protein